MNWTITERTISNNGIQRHAGTRDGKHAFWVKKFAISETMRALVVDGSEVLWSRNVTKMYEDGTTDPAYPMASGFAEVVSVEPSKRAGFVRIAYLDWAGKAHEVEACVGKPKKTRKAKVAV